MSPNRGKNHNKRWYLVGFPKPNQSGSPRTQPNSLPFCSWICQRQGILRLPLGLFRGEPGPLPFQDHRGPDGAGLPLPENNIFKFPLLVFKGNQFHSWKYFLILHGGLNQEAQKLTLTSRAFHNDALGEYCASVGSRVGRWRRWRRSGEAEKRRSGEAEKRTALVMIAFFTGRRGKIERDCLKEGFRT